MKHKRIISSVLLCFALAGCGTQIGISGKARGDYLKSIKSYGDYWVKAGMTKARQREDWMACGGRANGAYSSDAPSGSTNEVLSKADKKKRKALGDCMSAKGYRSSAPARARQ